MADYIKNDGRPVVARGPLRLGNPGLHTTLYLYNKSIITIT